MLGEMQWILIAEDEAEVREMFRNAILRKADSQGMLVHVVEACDGLEALSKASAREFDCILTDLKMPQKTGADVIRTLQEHPLNSNAPFVVISAHANDQFQPFLSEYDHIRYLAKPCTPEEVAKATISQLQYGRKDERVSVHLMNPFLKALKTKLCANSGKLEMFKPFIKNSGVAPKGEIHNLLTLTSGLSKAHFCISFDKAFSYMPEAAERTPEELLQLAKESGKRHERQARELILELIEEAGPQLKICLGGQPRLMAMTQTHRSVKDEPTYKALEKATTISVELATPNGRMFLSALAKHDFPEKGN